MARSTARKRALNTLYEADEKGQDILSLLAERIEHPGAQTSLPDYAVEIVRGVAEHRRTIDALLGSCSTRWKVSRMPVVDRNIMRIAVWEIAYNDEVPTGVAVDEALTLARTLCDADSPSFIHGVLTSVATAVDENGLSEYERDERPRHGRHNEAEAGTVPDGDASHADADSAVADEIADGVDVADMDFADFASADGTDDAASDDGIAARADSDAEEAGDTTR